jgi:hypothetical protein
VIHFFNRTTVHGCVVVFAVSGFPHGCWSRTWQVGQPTRSDPHDAMGGTMPSPHCTELKRSSCQPIDIHSRYLLDFPLSSSEGPLLRRGSSSLYNTCSTLPFDFILHDPNHIVMDRPAYASQNKQQQHTHTHTQILKIDLCSISI